VTLDIASKQGFNSGELHSIPPPLLLRGRAGWGAGQRGKDPNLYPKGWNRQKVQRMIAHYENQTDEEAIAEDEGQQKSG
jgi:hypothetical protein